MGARYYALEHLIAMLGKHIGDHLAWPSPRRIVLGRPVHFSVPADDELDQFAASRLHDAMRLAGFDEIAFEYEPVAAAYAYEARLTRDERILIGDFGGGTSDFTVMQVGPGVRQRGRRSTDILGTDGVPMAGDAFDKHLVRHLVAPRLGLGDEYLSPPDKLEAFLWLIRHDLGFQLHEAVQRTKFALSATTEAEFAFESGAVAIRTRVARA